MTERRRYRRRSNQRVIAMKLDLDTAGLVYRKWGARQVAKRGDWLVDRDGDVYTVDGTVFKRTYQQVRPGVYLKKTKVWAEVASRAGTIRTKEGLSRYGKGDYIVYNDEEGEDGYCMSARLFKSLYRAD